MRSLEPDPALGDRGDASRLQSADVIPSQLSFAADGDASIATAADASRVDERSVCAWCERPIPDHSRSGRRRRGDSRFCGKRCRQASHRFKIERAEMDATSQPMRFAYADPPYPGKAGYYPEGEEVDHEALLERLATGWPDGWALSTSAAALRDVLPLCPPEARVCAWVRSARPGRARRALSSWEPVIVVGGRPLSVESPQVLRDALVYQGRFRAFPGALVGMKPPPFSEWVFRMLGAGIGDRLDDLYPGSGAVGVAWARFVAPIAETTRRDLGDASCATSADASLLEHAGETRQIAV